MQQEFAVAESTVALVCGRHEAHAEKKLSGTLVFQDNALVVSYGRSSIPKNLGDSAGVLLICSLPKEFTPLNTKVGFEEVGRYPRVRAQFGAAFNKYVSDLENESVDMKPIGLLFVLDTWDSMFWILRFPICFSQKN